MADKPKTHTDSHTVRRIKFGLNVVVAVVVALTLVVLLNWIAARQYLRADLTRGGSYSLSAQTRAVLDKLGEGYRLITLIPDESRAPDEETALVWRRVRDMADEYARYSDGLASQHVDPRVDIKASTELNDAITEIYAEELEPVREAIRQGKDALQQIEPAKKQLTETLTQGLNNDAATEETRAQQLFRAALSRLTEVEQATEYAAQQEQELSDQVMVNYAGIKEQYEVVINGYDTLLGVILQTTEPLLRASDTDNADKDRLLRVKDLCEKIQSQLAEPIRLMAAAQGSPKYNQTLYDLSGGSSVVALGPDRVKVVPVRDMWRQDTRDYAETGQVQQQYLIEEKMTGALLSMTLEQPPMVVFLLSGNGMAIGPRGLYNIVAQRLESADFRVEQWNPAGQMTAMGQSMPPAPRPEPEPGQQTVWVVLPTPSNQMNPMMMASNPADRVAEVLRERLEAGDSALVLLAPDPNAAFGMTNPVLDVLGGWGISAQNDRVILREVQASNRRTETAMQFVIDTWPTTLAITSALDGMPATFYIPSPLTLTETPGVSIYPLVTLEGDRLWTSTDLSSPEAVRSARFNEADSAPPYTIAVAAEKEDGTRLVTTAEQFWASDDMTGYGPLGPGTADLFGAAYPGNSELFVNSVFWLSGLEDLIAASPRSQDVPRIQPMTADALWWHQVLLLTGLPGAALVLGLGVWWVRRKA